MGLAAVSGGLLIAFSLIILVVILGIIALVRFKSPAMWEESAAALYYRQVFRTVILITVGAIIALTIALPRWTRNSPPFSDSFVGMGLFETCACADPATMCGEPAGFRAVQGFSVLGLLSLAGLTVVTAVGASMEAAQAEQHNIDGPVGIAGPGNAAAVASSSPSAGPPAPSPQPPSIPTPRAADGSNHNNNNSAVAADGAPVDGDDNSGSSISLPNIIALVLLVFAMLCTLFAWIIFVGQNLNKACDGRRTLGATFSGGNVGWGWVFRFFEWLILLVALILFALSACRVVGSFMLTASRMHILSLLLLGMSCLSTTTTTWSFSDASVGFLNFTATSGTQSVGVFFACACSQTLCPASEASRAAAIAFYLLFFFFFVPRSFYVLVRTAVWQDALRPLYTCCDGICAKIDELKGKVSHKLARMLSGIYALCAPLFLLLATFIAAGVLAEEKCGAADQSADIGLVFSVLAIFMCWVEGFIAFLDGVMPVSVTQEEADEEAAKAAAAGVEEAHNAAGGDTESNKPGARHDGEQPQHADNSAVAHDANNFSDVVMRPPPGVEDVGTPRSSQSGSRRGNVVPSGGVSPSRMSPSDAGGEAAPPSTSQRLAPPPPPPPKVQAVTRISSE